METLHPVAYMPTSDWFVEPNQITKWTREENKQFESALAIYDKDTHDRWFKVAAMIPGKTVFDVIKQYKELEDDVSDIEAGLVPDPGYVTPSIALEWIDSCNFDAFTKRASTERKKGVPWTEDEHRRFLVGLVEHGRGDWRNIARNHVKTKTATQVASHAQKYFIRQLSVAKDNKRRPSIHDITTETVNLTDNNTPSDNHIFTSLDQSKILKAQKALHDLNRGNMFMSGMASNGTKFPGQNLYDIVRSMSRHPVFPSYSQDIKKQREFQVCNTC